MLVKCIIKVFLYLILAVMTLIHWLLLEPGGIDHLESDRNSQFELNRNSQCTLAN